MSIIDTEPWLKRVYDEKGFHRNKNKLPPFKRLMEHYPAWNMDDWLGILFGNGLLPPSDKGSQNWKKWQKEKPYLELSSLLKELEKSWKGPTIDVFPFPINVDQQAFMKELGQKNYKNGITFPRMILLFFHEEVPSKEKEALLIHEYHHACRLFFQKNDEKEISLLESIVMEGLAEFEVKRRLGEKYVSSWMNLYNQDQLLFWWEKSIEGKLHLKGRRKHIPFLYGGAYGIPRWLGYSIGYAMVQSFMERLAEEGQFYTPNELLKISSETIYTHSLFFSGASGRKISSAKLEETRKNLDGS